MTIPLVRYVSVRHRFEGFHNWPDAPDEVKFLRHSHRHEFHVNMLVLVSHNEREVEIILLKRRLAKFCEENYVGLTTTHSCETMAEQILIEFKAKMVELTEDGENGAVVGVRDDWPVSGGETRRDSTFVSAGDPPTKTNWGAFDQAVVKAAYEHLAAPVRTGPMPDHLKMRHKCFVGIEAEGPRRGVKTLFVPASVRPEDLPKPEWVKAQHIKHVYYGAGNDQNWRDDTWNTVLHIPDVYVTAETVSVALARVFPIPAHVTLVTLDKKEANNVGRSVGLNFYKEIVDGRIFWWLMDDQPWPDHRRICYVTPLSDPLFKGDVDVPDSALASH